jgi:hypothetical protein
MESYAAYNVETAYTELDVRIALPLTPANLQQQKAAYRDVSDCRLF